MASEQTFLRWSLAGPGLSSSCGRIFPWSTAKIREPDARLLPCLTRSGGVRVQYGRPIPTVSCGSWMTLLSTWHRDDPRSASSDNVR